MIATAIENTINFVNYNLTMIQSARPINPGREISLIKSNYVLKSDKKTD